MRSMSLEVVSPVRGSTVRPRRRSTALPMPSSTRRSRRSGKASSRFFFASSFDFAVESSESVMNSQYEFSREQFRLHSNLNSEKVSRKGAKVTQRRKEDP